MDNLLKAMFCILVLGSVIYLVGCAYRDIKHEKEMNELKKEKLRLEIERLKIELELNNYSK